MHVNGFLDPTHPLARARINASKPICLHPLATLARIMQAPRSASAIPSSPFLTRWR